MAFWGRGFRPFFFKAAVFAVLAVPLWAFVMSGIVPGAPGIFSDPLFWHAHEMIFGFTMAVVAGFLLTAVANWTGWAPVRGAHLFFLVALWAFGRAASAFPDVPFWLAGAINLVFIPCLAVSLFVPLWKSGNIRNFVFLGLLSVLFILESAFFALQDVKFLHAALFVMMAVVGIVGGRIVPSFSVAWLRFHGQHVQQKDLLGLDKVSFSLSLFLAGIVLVFGTDAAACGIAAFALAGVQTWRWRFYYPLATLAEPMLWILHAGFFWMILGFALLGLSAFGFAPISSAIHALTAGSIGSLTLGMMCRVTMGHTGRMIRANRATIVSFYLMQLSAALRVLGPVAFPGEILLVFQVSGVLWAACFLIYLFVYGPLLFKKSSA